MKGISLAAVLYYIINVVCVISIIFAERKKTQSIIAWVFVVTFLPGLGLFLYIFIGRTFTIVKRKNQFAKTKYYQIYNEFAKKQSQVSKEKRNIFIDNQEKQCADLIALNLNEGGSAFTYNNKTTLFTNAQEKYENLLFDIENAKESVNIQYFIFRNDGIGKKILSALVKKAKEGVRVQLLYDEYGDMKVGMKFFAEIVKAGGNVRHFYGSYYSNFINTNNRNHRKIVVIDGLIGYVGGMNIGDEHLSLHKTITPWRDTHLRLQGDAVYMLQVRFLLDWYFSSKGKVYPEDEKELSRYFPPNHCDGNMGVQIVSSGPDVEEEAIKNAYIKMIGDANFHIYIQTPYFVPDESLMASLKIAALSGLDVRIMIPKVPDKKLVYEVTTLYAEELHRAGAKIYLYNGFIHAKTIVVDRAIASVGTANFDIRSFALNFEVNAFVFDEQFAKQCEEIFLADIENSEEMTKEHYMNKSRYKRGKQKIIRLLAPLS